MAGEGASVGTRGRHYTVEYVNGPCSAVLQPKLTIHPSLIAVVILHDDSATAQEFAEFGRVPLFPLHLFFRTSQP